MAKGVRGAGDGGREEEEGTPVISLAPRRFIGTRLVGRGSPPMPG
jgi:hypothetical protein